MWTFLSLGKKIVISFACSGKNVPDKCRCEYDITSSRFDPTKPAKNTQSDSFIAETIITRLCLIEICLVTFFAYDLLAVGIYLIFQITGNLLTLLRMSPRFFNKQS